jgi:site-specific DNA recombinase
MTIAGTADGDGQPQKIKAAWSIKATDFVTVVEGDNGSESAHNRSLIQSTVRAHGWMHALQDGAFESIEQLAEANSLHPKVVRQALRLAFLSPEVTSAILEGRQPNGLSLARVPKLLALSWTEHRPLLRESLVDGHD